MTTHLPRRVLPWLLVAVSIMACRERSVGSSGVTASPPSSTPSSSGAEMSGAEMSGAEASIEATSNRARSDSADGLPRAPRGKPFPAKGAGAASEARGFSDGSHEGSSRATVVGSKTRVVAKNKLGVPLHGSPGNTGVSGRLRDGESVTVLRTERHGHWLEVRGETGKQGWITRRYAPDLPEPRFITPTSVWSSAEACQRAVRSGQRLQRPRTMARIGSWNIRWFPDSKPKPSKEGTDLDWLACTIAYLNLDVLLVQEFQIGERAKRKLDLLLKKLQTHTGQSFRAEFDACSNPRALHVGVIFNTARVKAREFQTYGALNPHKHACTNNLRPGFGGYFEFPGGLDLHLVSVHLESGPTAREFELRKRTWPNMQKAMLRAKSAVLDDDIVFGGDFNTMGCTGCEPKLAAHEELRQLKATIGGLKWPLRLISAEPSCTEYFAGKGGALDHLAAPVAMAELPAAAKVRVSGYCAELACKPLRGGKPNAYRRLSDHCPLFLDIPDRDLD